MHESRDNFLRENRRHALRGSDILARTESVLRRETYSGAKEVS